MPIDHTAPVERVHSILRLSGCRLLITQQSVAPAAEQLPPAVDILVADKGWHQFSSGPVTNPEMRCNIHSLVYINFTSGSTGEPKGIPVEHLGRSLLAVKRERPQHVYNYMRGWTEGQGFGLDCRCGQCRGPHLQRHAGSRGAARGPRAAVDSHVL